MRRESGIALVGVLVFLLVIAAAVALRGGEETADIKLAAADAEARRVDYVAQAGLQRALWTVQQNACAGGATIPATNLDGDSYAATITGGGTTTAYTLLADQDAAIYESSPTLNDGANPKNPVTGDAGDFEQLLTRFDLAALPASARINSALAWFHLESGQAHPEGPIDVHAVTADWTETTVTWDSFNGGYATEILGTIPPQDIDDVWIAINLTGQVQAWVNGQPNHGILFESQAAGVGAEYAAREDSSNAPYLEVVVGTGSPSPVNIQATGTLANGKQLSLARPTARAYQPPGIAIMQPDESGQDTYIDDGAPGTNFGTASPIRISNRASRQKRGLLRFDIGSIPAGASVRSATLELNLEGIGSGAVASIDVHRTTAGWHELEANWTDASMPDWWTSPGGDWDPTVIDTAVIDPAAPGPTTWDLTTLVTGWVNGTYANYGVFLLGSDGVNHADFTSSDSTDPSLRPKLTVEYGCQCASACLAPQGKGNVLMVVYQKVNPLPGDVEIQTMLESWGYTVTMISDEAGQGGFNAEFGDNDVVFVSESVDPWTLWTKLSSAPIGVVTAEAGQTDELGIATGQAFPVGATLDIVDNDHYITRPFPAGALAFKTAATELAAVAGTLAPDARVLANASGAGAVVVLDAGSMGSGGAPVPARRALVPVGDIDVSWTYLTGNGRLLIQRAIAWAMGADITSAGNALLVVANLNNPTAQEAAKQALIESWNFTVSLIDDSDDQATFDAAIAANDVAYIPQDITSSNLGTKLVNATIGVVNEEGEQVDELGFANGVLFKSRDEINVIDNSHYITETFATGLLTITSSLQSVHILDGGSAPGLQVLGETLNVGSIWNKSFGTLDPGDELSGGGSAAGRRVELPWGGGTFDVTALNADGLTIMRRALEWGAGIGGAPATQPIAHWMFDEGSGSTAFDSVGGNDATLNGDPSWVAGTLGDALDFDGAGDFALTDATFTPPPVGTVTFWTRVSGPPAAHGRILGLDDTWEIRHVTDGTADGIPYGLVFDLGVSGVNTEFVTTTTIDVPGRWYHIAAAYDTNTDEYAVYIDGAPDTSGTYSSALTVPAANNLSIGTRTGSTDYFDGTLDDVRIYDEVLSAAEIAALAAAWEQPAVLMVVADPAAPTAEEATTKALIESWSYVVELIDDDDTQTNFDAAAAIVDAAFISGDVNASALSTKLNDATIGVVIEEHQSWDEFGLCSDRAGTGSMDVEIADNSHYVTEPFPAGSLTILTSSADIMFCTATLAPGALPLIKSATANPGLITLDAGALRLDAQPSTGRRVTTAWGGTWDPSKLNSDGEQLLRRSLEWASGEGDGGTGGGGPTGVTFEEFTEASNGNATSLDIAKPGVTGTGDLLIATLATDGSTAGSMAPPAGWTVIDLADQSGAVTFGVWWKLAGASEPASYTFSWSGNEAGYGAVMRFSGHDATNPINDSAAAGGSSSAPASPAVTTTVADTMILRLGGFDDDDIDQDVTGLTGHTTIMMDDTGNGPSTTSSGAGYVLQSTAGGSGTANFALTGTEEYRSVTLAIAPAP